ncbi:MAG: hypothetical protein ACRDCE_22780 [Cetobacterium sp.]|uniref:hypothetical protein n=1 Tax=Cetobacterium sp. TaxID=2071632 RepID=UPI003EE64161
MDINAMLSDYRKGFGLVREGANKAQEATVQGSQSHWDTALSIPQGNVQPGWGNRVELPEELPDFYDERDVKDPAMNQENFKAYIGEHPFAIQKGQQIEDMIRELSEMVQDPENPITYEDAERMYTEEFTKMYEGWEMGGEE